MRKCELEPHKSNPKLNVLVYFHTRWSKLTKIKAQTKPKRKTKHLNAWLVLINFYLKKKYSFFKIQNKLIRTISKEQTQLIYLYGLNSHAAQIRTLKWKNRTRGSEAV